jgi:RHS repeat-associated protein
VVSPQNGPCFNDFSGLYREKIPRFSNLPTQDFWSSNPLAGVGSVEDAEEVYNAQVAIICNTVCESYADEWMSKLSGCTLSSAQQATLRSQLIAVCVGGCDQNNIEGASTVAPNSGITPASFQAVLLNVVGVNGISAVCSELLISEPRPYGQNLSQVQNAKLDNCGCDKIKQAEADFIALSAANALPAGVSNLQQMLAYNQGISIDNVEQLLCACNQALGSSTWTPGYTWSSAQLTALQSSGIITDSRLSCSSTGCQSCTAITDLVASFHAYFGATTSTEIESFKEHENYEVLYTNYLNNALGYHLSFEAYEAFLESCNADAQNPGCYITPLGTLLKDAMNVIARQGFLTSLEAQAYNMGTQNIVYSNSSLPNFLPGNLYWTNYQAGASSMELNFGSSSTLSKQLTLSLEAGADFGFEDIISVLSLTAIQDCEDAQFRMRVNIISCGEIQERELLGTSSDLQMMSCYCNTQNLVLCNDLNQEPNPAACYEEQLMIITSISQSTYQQAIAAKKEAFLAAYKAKCAEAFASERLTISGFENYYQHTLYYYDQANNLRKTVAPEGIKQKDGNNNYVDVDPTFATTGILTVDADRDNRQSNVPNYGFKTEYIYNSYDQVVSTTNPDQEGQTDFFYDFYGRLVGSQNPIQRDENKFSYTLYDPQGRPYEVGVASIGAGGAQVYLSAIAVNDNGASFTQAIQATTRQEVTRTIYDRPLSLDIANKFQTIGQKNVRLRVASVLHFDVFDANTQLQTGYQSAIHYSYDPHGNVIEQLQDVPELAPVAQDVKSTQYSFELISGNVKEVSYQAGYKDQMTHTYTYDKMERLRKVYTSTDGGIHKAQEAHYKYYDYGPLARVEQGEHQVQASDYVYTINGWLKGSNSSTLNPTRDAGKDGTTGYVTSNLTQHAYFAQDVVAYTLGYFEGDYKASGNSQFEATLGGELQQAIKKLYNGNIAYTTMAIKGFETQASVYGYDQLNRLKSMSVYRDANLSNTNTWGGSSFTSEYYNKYQYDLNGNITSLLRNANQALGLSMDELSYSYDLLNGQRSNRLNHVNDITTPAYTGSDDLENQNEDNYRYDKLGQLLGDEQEGVLYYWRIGDKKLERMVNMNPTAYPQKPDVEYRYNPFGQRVLKVVKTRENGVIRPQEEWKYYYYSYDANGQVMALYEVQMSSTENTARISEQHIYGASRLGMVKQDALLYENGNELEEQGEIVVNILGAKRYEITNYLGNVNAVITDRKVYAAPSNTIAIYEAVVVLKADYYPFGMTMPGRHESGEGYRFGYQGSEVDIEVKGEGNSYTTEFRQLDPRLGRWLSVDPLAAKYTDLSPYNFVGNMPIIAIDPDGRDIIIVINKKESVKIVYPSSEEMKKEFIKLHENNQFVIDTYLALIEIKENGGVEGEKLVDFFLDSKVSLFIKQNTNFTNEANIGGAGVLFSNEYFVEYNPRMITVVDIPNPETGSNNYAPSSTLAFEMLHGYFIAVKCLASLDDPNSEVKYNAYIDAEKALGSLEEETNCMNVANEISKSCGGGTQSDYLTGLLGIEKAKSSTSPEVDTSKTTKEQKQIDVANEKIKSNNEKTKK